MSRETRNFAVIFQPVDEDGFTVVECPAFEGCVTHGRTKKEALANIAEAIAACLAAGDVPSPHSGSAARF